MANTAPLSQTLVTVFKLVVLAVGTTVIRDSVLRDATHPELSRTKTNKFGQTTPDVDRMDRINMIKYCNFLSKHGLTLDDNLSAFVSRNIQTLPTLFSMATLKHKTNKTRPSPEKINEIRNFLMKKSDKTNDIFEKAGISNHSGIRYTQDDSDLMKSLASKQSIKRQAKTELQTPGSTDAPMAAEPQGTDPIVTDLDLNDSCSESFAEIINNTKSYVIPPDEIDHIKTEILDLPTGLDKPIIGTAHPANIVSITPVISGTDSPVLTVNTPPPGTDKWKRGSNTSSSISEVIIGSPIPTKKRITKKPKSDKYVPKFTTLERSGPLTALTNMATDMHSKVTRKIANQIKKLTQTQREATPNISKTKPKRDISIGSPVSDIDLASPEHKKHDFDLPTPEKLDFSTSLEDFSNDTSNHSLMANQMKDNSLSKSPFTRVKPSSNGDMAPALVEALSPMLEIKPIKPISASTPIIPDKTKTDTTTCPNSPDTVSENPPPPIIILDNDEARPNTTDTVPTQAITEPEVMEIVDLTIDKSKTPSDGTRTPAKTDALAPPPENQSIKQAKTNTPAIMARPDSPDTVSAQAITEPEVMEIVDLTTDKSKTQSDGTRTPAKTDAPAPPPESQSIKQAKTCTSAIHSSPNVSRADNDKNWRSTENRDVDQIRELYSNSANANLHSPGKGPSVSNGISLSQMTPEQQLHRTLTVSKVDTGLGRQTRPASPGSDLDTSGTQDPPLI